MTEASLRAGYPIRWADDRDGDGMVWNTLDAHILLHWAAEHCGPEKQTALSSALFDAHFQQALAIADRGVLADVVASAPGLDAAKAITALDDQPLKGTVLAEEQRGRAMGISSVPTLVTADGQMFEGSHEPEDYAQWLRELTSHAA